MKRIDALNNRNSASTEQSRVPLVLTYYLLNERIKQILLDNFNTLSSDPESKETFPQPPLVAYRRDRNLRDILVHTTNSNQPSPFVGPSPCAHTRCRTCDHISPDTNLRGPRCSFDIKEGFTRQTTGSADRLSALHLLLPLSCSLHRRTGPTLRQRLVEHLRIIEKNLPGFPVTEHFNTNCLSLRDAQVRDIMLCDGNRHRKRQEMRLTFKLVPVSRAASTPTSVLFELGARAHFRTLFNSMASWRTLKRTSTSTWLLLKKG